MTVRVLTDAESTERRDTLIAEHENALHRTTEAGCPACATDGPTCTDVPGVRVVLDLDEQWWREVKANVLDQRDHGEVARILSVMTRTFRVDGDGDVRDDNPPEVAAPADRLDAAATMLDGSPLAGVATFLHALADAHRSTGLDLERMDGFDAAVRNLLTWTVTR